MEEWKEYKLGDLADCKLGKMLDQKKNKGIPRTYLGNVAVRWGGFNIDPSQKMLIEDDEISRYELKKGDIVICEGGEPGRCAIWESDAQIFIQKALHRVRVKGTIANNYFIYYHFRNLVKQGRVEPYYTGSTIKHLPRERLISLRIFIPSLSTQHGIASILKSLDDKIEVNRRISENLEAQAQALFKSWFVDFEPFRDGEFVESELGMIPKGWRVGTLIEIADITMGTSPVGTSYNTEGIGDVFYQGRAEFGFRFPNRNLYTTEAKRFADVDTVLVSVRAPVGDINVAEERCCIGRGLASVKSKNNSNSFILYLMKSMRPVFERFNGEGTVFGSINKKAFEEMQIIIPAESVVEKFDTIVCSMDCQIKRTVQESRRLATLRDTLLPKLMSGELKVNEIAYE